MMSRILGLLVTALLAVTHATPAESALAIVVHPDNPMSSIDRDLLARLYLGRVTVLPHGEEVFLVQFEPDLDRFTRLVLDMSPDRVRKQWIRLVFSAQSVTPPVTAKRPDEVTAYVADNEGAIGFLDESLVDETVKVLRVEEKAIDDVDYPLQ